MFLIFLRVLIIYFTVLVFLRLMGKRQIGEMQPYELVITLIIADLATLPMSDTNIPLLNGILPLAILVLIHYLITFITRKSIFFRRIISGKPVVVISPKGIEYQTLKDLNMNIDDLIESLRQCNYYNFDQVLYAIIETNGKMSVVPVSSVAPATAEDVKVNNPPAQLPHILISDGKLIKNELKQINLSQDELNAIISHFKLKQKKLIILSIDESGKVYYQQKGEQYKVVEDYKKEVKLWNFGFHF